jgi:hypothetical protein
MKEYRENLATETETDEAPSSDSDSEDPAPGYMTLAQQYGLSDDMEIGNSGSSCQATIEQEYQAYITAPLSPKTMNILKFWEVSYVAWNGSWWISNVLILR